MSYTLEKTNNKFTLESYQKLNESPFQSKERHNRNAKHLNNGFTDNMRFISIGVVDGEQYLVDGHTRRQYIIADKLKLPKGTTFNAAIYKCDNMDSLRELGRTFDNANATETQKHIIQGNFSSLGINADKSIVSLINKSVLKLSGKKTCDNEAIFNAQRDITGLLSFLSEKTYLNKSHVVSNLLGSFNKDELNKLDTEQRMIATQLSNNEISIEEFTNKNIDLLNKRRMLTETTSDAYKKAQKEATAKYSRMFCDASLAWIIKSFTSITNLDQETEEEIKHKNQKFAMLTSFITKYANDEYDLNKLLEKKIKHANPLKERKHNDKVLNNQGVMDFLTELYKNQELSLKGEVTEVDEAIAECDFYVMLVRHFDAYGKKEKQEEYEKVLNEKKEILAKLQG